MLVLISDASVLIDIECAQITEAMFKLPWQFAVPDILFSEELSERHQHLLDYGLICRTMNGELMMEAYNLRKKYLCPSLNDLLALTLAKHEHCQLLTGDKALREIAAQVNVEVHGTIWLVQQMLQNKQIPVELAMLGFQRMKKHGSRLPWNKVDNMLRDFVSVEQCIENSIFFKYAV